MNLIHGWLCGSALWKKTVKTYILPWTLEGLDLGAVVDPATFPARLRAAGFSDVMKPHAFRFRARKSAPHRLSFER